MCPHIGKKTKQNRRLLNKIKDPVQRLSDVIYTSCRSDKYVYPTNIHEKE